MTQEHNVHTTSWPKMRREKAFEIWYPQNKNTVDKDDDTAFEGV